MKIADLSPLATPFRAGRSLKASSWTATDEVVTKFGPTESVRTVAHYGTVMGEFVSTEGGDWHFLPLSTGWGSVSDQKAMNTLFQSVGSLVRMKRDGGNPRYVHGGTGLTLDLGLWNADDTAPEVPTGWCILVDDIEALASYGFATEEEALAEAEGYRWQGVVRVVHADNL